MVNERDPGGFGRIVEREAGVGGVGGCANRAAVQAEREADRGEEGNRDNKAPNGSGGATEHSDRSYWLLELVIGYWNWLLVIQLRKRLGALHQSRVVVAHE